MKDTKMLNNFLESLMNAQRSGRENYHVTLGEAIAFLEKVPARSAVVVSDSSLSSISVESDSPHSYRGYYSDLAIAPAIKQYALAGDFLEILKGSLNKTFTGYKGGEYIMDEHTPLWISRHGECDGTAIVDIFCDDAENVVLAVKKV